VSELVILFVVSFICVGVDGAIGLMVGAVISILRTAIKTSKANAIEARTSDDGEVLILAFTGQVSYVNALQAEVLGVELIQNNQKDSEFKYVLADLSNVTFFDIDGLNVFENLHKHATKKENLTFGIRLQKAEHRLKETDGMLDQNDFFSGPDL